MDARSFYASRQNRGLAGLIARALSHVFLRVRPPALYDEHAIERRVFTELVGGTGRVLLLGSNLTPSALEQRGYPHATQLDMSPYPNVDVVADAEAMGRVIPEGSFDFVVSTSMVEHTSHPWLVLQECFKVLSLGGVLYVDAPWMYPLHGEPNDFFRFSEAGLRGLTEDAGFTVVESGASVSGHGAFATFLQAYLSEIASLDRTILYYSMRYILMWLLYPLGLLERLAPLTRRKHRFTDSIVYVVAVKPSTSSTSTL